MSKGYGENSSHKATSDDYRNSSYWDKRDAEKKKEAETEAAKRQLKDMGIL